MGLQQEDAKPGKPSEVKTVAVVTLVNLELGWQVHEAVLRNRLVPAHSVTEARRGHASACSHIGSSTYTALPRQLPHHASVKLMSVLSFTGKRPNLVE